MTEHCEITNTWESLNGNCGPTETIDECGKVCDNCGDIVIILITLFLWEKHFNNNDDSLNIDNRGILIDDDETIIFSLFNTDGIGKTDTKEKTTIEFS